VDAEPAVTVPLENEPEDRISADERHDPLLAGFIGLMLVLLLGLALAIAIASNNMPADLR
jgi:hypothetical protein